jgi:hypothetical protein
MRLFPVIALLSGLIPTVAPADVISADDPSIIYTTFGDEGTGPTWNVGPNGEHYSDFTTTAPVYQVYGADAVVNFDGTGITWIGNTGPDYGVAAYSLDGGPTTTFDAYSSQPISQNDNVTISGLAPGPHSLKIEVTPFDNSASSGHYQAIDGFNIQGSALPLSQGTVAGYNSPALSFTGAWTCGADASDLSGGHCYSNAANASLSWTFTGSLVEVYGRPNLENGIFDVLIDGTQVGQVDGHFGNADLDELNGYGLFQATVPFGTHTIELVNTGTHDPGATDDFMQIDMFAAFSPSPAPVPEPSSLALLAGGLGLLGLGWTGTARRRAATRACLERLSKAAGEENRLQGVDLCTWNSVAPAKDRCHAIAYPPQPEHSISPMR